MSDSPPLSGLVHLVHFPVEVLGPGKRAGIWLQGCPRRCPGCFSPHTREFEERFRVSLKEITDRLRGFALFTDKLTISGGEPFEQPAFLLELLRSARRTGFRDILVYSGLVLGDLRPRFPEILDQIDVLIDGEFRQEAPTRKVWRGSANQQMHLLTSDPELRSLYAGFLEAEEDQGRMQVLQIRGETHLIGIPRHPALADRLDP